MNKTACRKLVLQGAFGMAVFIFWWKMFSAALAWHEQFQLFLFDGQYLLERLAVPGGAAAYVAEFIVQFYNHTFVGAVVLAVLFVLLQDCVWKLVKVDFFRAKQSETGFILSFLPSLALWMVMGEANIMLAMPVSLLLVLVTARAVPVTGKGCMLYYVAGIPAVYWLAGPMVFVWILLLCIRWLSRSWTSWPVQVITWLGMLGYALACIWLSALVEPYPLRRLLAGIFYYRIPDAFPYLLWLPAAMCLLLVSLAVLLGRQLVKGRRRWQWMAGGALALVAVWVVLQEYDSRTYELIEYDYLVRTQQWEKIIRKAEKHPPDFPMGVCAVNLALGMTGQLGERAFEFFQNGPEGLFPKFTRNFNTIQLTGEVYYCLGLVNTAQRYAFEAMEGIPNYNKSGRSMKRLAETNLINGQYKVAEKYLLMLCKTVFYRKWAQSRLKMLADPGQIDNHPVDGRMRQLRLQEDYLFSEMELDKICGQLFIHNRRNQLAIQYLLLYPLLGRDLDGFMKYYNYVNSVMHYNPIVCQEAVVFICMVNKKEIPKGVVGNDVLDRFKRFAQTYTCAGKDSPQLEAFRNTLWYYLIKGQK